MPTRRDEQETQAQACRASGFVPVKKIYWSGLMHCTGSSVVSTAGLKGLVKIEPHYFGNVKSVAQPALYQISHLIKRFQITKSYDI